ncbi:unnamed protein product [Clonostachys solani]|uniref:Uncharacterized protein n=1 Tax=Clonostachys solani TaxID=160281 RepID=A0A9N9YZL3_9HYPO|nr:unnamed protein product [Clonostachys solani]
MSNVKKEDKKLVSFVETNADPMSENKEATEHVESASQILDEGCRHEQARSMVHGEVVDSDLSAGPSIEHEETEPDLSSQQ